MWVCMCAYYTFISKSILEHLEQNVLRHTYVYKSQVWVSGGCLVMAAAMLVNPKCIFGTRHELFVIAS